MCKTHNQSPMTWIQDGVLKFSDKEDGHPLKIIYKSKYFILIEDYLRNLNIFYSQIGILFLN